MCWSCLTDNHWHSRPLYIKTLFLAWHDSRHVVCLHSPQTKVCLLCAGTLGSFSTTLSVSVCLRSSQTGVCSLRAEVPSWLKLLALPSVASQKSFLRPTRLLVVRYVFKALRSKSARYMLGLVFCLAWPSVQPFVFVAIRPESIRYMLGPAQHDPRRNRLSSQPSDRSLFAACQDFAP